MLVASLIGHLGADAKVESSNGREFTAFRVAHSEKWTNEKGVVTEKTIWVDVIINGRPGVLPYLKKGQAVFVYGSQSVRVYSSAKDRCFKAGITINASKVELLGGKNDDIPSTLYTEDGKSAVEVGKFFYSPRQKNGKEKPQKRTLLSKSGERFVQDEDGWIAKEVADENPS